MFERALRGYEKVLGLEHTSTINTVNNLGALYAGQGKLDQAEEMYQRALGGYEKIFRAEHTLILNTVNNLGLLYQRQGRLDDAEEMHVRTLAGREQVLGVDHPDTLMSMNNLASVLRFQEKYDEAESLIRRALVGRKKMPHSHTMTSTHLSSSEPMSHIRGKFADIRFNLDLDTEEDLKEEKEGRDHSKNSDEEFETVELDGEMTPLVFGSDLQTVSSDSESSSSTSGEDKMTPASRPRTKVGRSQNTFVGYMKSKRHEWKRKKSASTFGQRRSFSRRLAESREIIENNSPHAAWHQWPAKLESPPESTLSVLGSDTVVTEASENHALDSLLAYSRRLYKNWSTLLRGPNASVSVTALAYDPHRNVVSVVEVNLLEIVLLRRLTESADFVASRSLQGHVLGLSQKYRNTGNSFAPWSGLSSFIPPWNGLFEDLIRYLQMLVQALDLAMLSHLNAHASSGARESFEQLIRVPVRPALTISAEEVLVFRPYRLACLDGLTRGRKAWVFHRRESIYNRREM